MPFTTEDLVMTRSEWLEFLKLTYDELQIEYPNPRGIDRDIVIQTLEMNSD